MDNPFPVEVTGIFNESSEGDWLLEFLTHEEHFRKTAMKEEVKKVCKMLNAMATKDDNGRLVLNSSNELILIYKRMYSHS
jgi:hypothetical protein